MTLTWVSVTSGNASMGSALNAAKPPATKSSRPRTMNSGFCSANATIRLIIGLAAALRRGAAAQLAMETMQEQIAFDDHFLAELDAGGNARDPVPHGVDLDLLARIAAGLLLDENEVAAAGEQQRPLRNLQVGGGRFLHVGGDEHLALEPALAVFHRAAHLHCPRRGIDEVGDGLDGRGERLVRPCRSAQVDFPAGPQRSELVLRGVELHP